MGDTHSLNPSFSLRLYHSGPLHLPVILTPTLPFLLITLLMTDHTRAMEGKGEGEKHVGLNEEI